MKAATITLCSVCLALLAAAPSFAQDSLNVRRLGSCWLPGRAAKVAVAGNYAYVADEGAGLRVVDISNPAVPVEVGSCLTLGSAWDVEVSGNYAYVADNTWGLRVVDIACPSFPVVVGSCHSLEGARGVAVSGNYAYVVDGYSCGMRVVDITNPAAPFEVGFYATGGGAWGIGVAGSYAYVARGSNALRIVNIANPLNPVEVSVYSAPGWTWDVAVWGIYAYVADEGGGLRVVDISNPSAPTEVGVCDTRAVAVTVSENWAYVGAGFSGLRVVNITTPGAPFEAGFYDMEMPGYACGIAVRGILTYVVDENYLGIYDCSQAICGGISSKGEVRIVRFGAPDWGYRLVHRQGCLDRLVFTRFCPGTTGRVTGAAAANWSMLAGGDGNNGDSIIFVTTTPLTSGSVDTFWLSHPNCVDVVTWCAGDTCGSIDGPLPVELLSFSAAAGDAQVLLRWQTASETGTERFEIERDGRLAHREAAVGDATGHSYSWTDRNLVNGESHHYALWSVETNGERSLLRETEATPRAGIVTVTEYALHGNYPNPFNPVTEIAFDLPEAADVSLKVFDVMGREVAVLVNGEKTAGRHAVRFDARDLPSGVYLCRMTANEFTAARKMVLVR
jgi:hypothetical protein